MSIFMLFVSFTFLHADPETQTISESTLQLEIEREFGIQQITYPNSRLSPSTYNKIKKVIRKRQFTLLGKIIGEKLGSKFSLKELKTLAIEQECPPVINAMKATSAIYNLDCGLSRKKIAQLSLFLETKFSDYIKNKKYYLQRKHLPIACAIQYDPQTKRKFIHLKGEIGSGSKKIVSRSILYHKRSPEIVARCMQDEKKGVSEETQYTKLAQGPGIVKARAFTRHKAHGKTQYTLFSKLYKPGSLRRFLSKKKRFTFKEKVQIALNISKGIERLHRNEVVHRDLGPANYLINVSYGKKNDIAPKSKKRSRVIDVVVADLGRANHISKIRGERPQGHTIFTAPEGVFRHKMKGKDYLKTDIFAMGSLFYAKFYRKIPIWQKVNYIKAKGSAKKRFKKLYAAVAKGTDKRRDQLTAKKNKRVNLKPKEAFEKLILQMCHKRAHLRPTAAQVRIALEEIMKKLK
jgi:serine/threonine protein kinase